MSPGLKRVAWILNTLGFVFYLVWLSTLDARATLRSQDGILFYIPCVPFLFVYMLLINPKPGPKGKPWWQSDEDYAREQLEKQNQQENAEAKRRGALLRQGAWWWAFRNDKDGAREPPDKQNNVATAPDAPPPPAEPPAKP